MTVLSLSELYTEGGYLGEKLMRWLGACVVRLSRVFARRLARREAAQAVVAAAEAGA